MESEELVAIIEGEINASIGGGGAGAGLGSGNTVGVSHQLAIERAMELDYYNSKPFGNEREGESQVVTSDVFDAIESMLPHLLKTFTASDDVVEFQPNGPEDEEQAKQRSEVCNYVFYRQNNGFITMYEWFKDALMQKNGIVKYWWEEKTDITEDEYEGLTEGEYLMMEQDKDVEILEAKNYDDPTALEEKANALQKLKMQAQNNPQALQMLAQLEQQPVPKMYDCKIKTTKDASKICIESVPPEEFGISARHKCVSIQEAPFVFHRKLMTISELRQLGCPDDIIEALSGDDGGTDSKPEILARNRFIDEASRATDSETDPSSKQVWVVECFIRIDYDEDGIAELRHIIKPGREIWINEPASHINFAAITPIIMPHRFVGKSIAEIVMDIQFNRSVLMRQMFNNLYLTNNPQKVVLGSAGGVMQADIDRLLTSRVGGVLVEYTPNAIRNQEVPFVAGASFPMLEFLAQEKENRTGVTRYNQGSDADSLNKLLDLDTPVPMADGSYKTMGTVESGDFVIGGDGLAVKVIMAHPIQMPERAYRLTFKSGDEIVAGGEHLWHVMTQRNLRDGIHQIVNTDTLASKDIKEGHAYHWNVPRVWGAEFEEKDLPLDPYIFGLWLGDGTGSSGAITTCDDEILLSIEKWASENGGKVVPCNSTTSGLAETYRVHGLSTILNRMGVLRYKNAGEKHIPEIYLRSSYAQRLALLQGLMDTDGCAHSDGAMAIFCQKEGRLLADALRLMESLGAWPSARELVITESMYHTDNRHFQVSFSLDSCPFRLTRKAARHIPVQRCASSQPIIGIEKVEIRPMRCLTVDAEDGLYCVGKRFTVTHNTAHGIAMIQQASQQKIDLIARIFAETGVKDLFRGIAYLLSKHSTKAMTVRLRGKWVDIDPRQWKSQFDMTVNVGLGTGNKDAQLAHLDRMHATQLELLQTGKGYMVTDQNLYNVAVKRAEYMGFKHPDMFLTDPSKVKPPPPQPNPDLLKIQQADAEAKSKIQSTEKIRQFDAQTQKEIEAIKSQTAIEIARINAASNEKIVQLKSASDVQIEVFKANANLNDEKNAMQVEKGLMQLSKNIDNQQLTKAVEDVTGSIADNVKNAVTPVADALQQHSAAIQQVNQSATVANQTAAELKAQQDAMAQQIQTLSKAQVNNDKVSKRPRKHEVKKTADGYEIISVPT